VSVQACKPWGQADGEGPARASGSCGGHLRSPIDQAAAHRASGIDQAAVRAGRAGRSAGLGRSRICVIDDDLGVSAAVAGTRPGFAKLVTEVKMARVGIVLGIEMSRLARTGRDWHQLLELCSLSGTLLADPDGVYDPGWYNDRLLLGLKGTMSEALCGLPHKASYADLRIMPRSCSTD
jgi:DNA invertase Pin-like site-specific DNA recombinase